MPGSPIPIQTNTTLVRGARALVRLGSRLPLAWLHALAVPLAALARMLRTREAHVAQRNIDLVFPELEPAMRQRLLRDTLRHTGMSLTELPKLWGQPGDALALVHAVEGREHLDAALAGNRGVLIAAPHLGSWELLNLWLSRQAPMAILYRVPQRIEFDSLLRDARGAFGAEPVRADPAGVRTLFRRLKEGFIVGILPDQRPKSGEGAWGSFFGQPTKTMTLLGRLAQKSRAPVLLAWAERLPRSAGFDIHIEPVGEEIYDADPELSTRALNAAIETAVRHRPAQYQWTYKRFGMRRNLGDALPY